MCMKLIRFNLNHLVEFCLISVDLGEGTETEESGVLTCTVNFRKLSCKFHKGKDFVTLGLPLCIQCLAHSIVKAQKIFGNRWKRWK